MIYSASGMLMLVFGFLMLKIGMPKGGVVKPFAAREAYTFGVMIAMVFGFTLFLQGILS